MKNAKIDFAALKGDLFVALKLTLICFVTVLLLGIANLLTHGQIQKNNAKAENMTNALLLPDGVTFDRHAFDNPKIQADNKEEYYYVVKDASGTPIGYTVSVTGSGYGGAMKVMVGFDNAYTVANVKLLHNAETPGVGKNAEKPGYEDKFKGTNTADKPIPTRKSMLRTEDADSVTGATITFNGISAAVQKAAAMLQLQTQITDSDNSDDTEAHDE